MSTTMELLAFGYDQTSSRMAGLCSIDRQMQSSKHRGKKKQLPMHGQPARSAEHGWCLQPRLDIDTGTRHLPLTRRGKCRQTQEWLQGAQVGKHWLAGQVDVIFRINFSGSRAYLADSL